MDSGGLGEKWEEVEEVGVRGEMEKWGVGGRWSNGGLGKWGIGGGGVMGEMEKWVGEVGGGDVMGETCERWRRGGKWRSGEVWYG